MFNTAFYFQPLPRRAFCFSGGRPDIVFWELKQEASIHVRTPALPEGHFAIVAIGVVG